MDNRISPYYVANPFDDHSPGFWDRYLAHPQGGLDSLEGGGVSEDSASLHSSDSEGGSHRSSSSCSLSLSNVGASSLAVEVLGLPSRLAERQRQHTRDALTTHSSAVRDTLSAASLALAASGTPSSAPAGEWVIPPIFAPESPRRVAAEASAVSHMLSTAAYWLASVDIVSVPPAVQEELSKLAETCLFFFFFCIKIYNAERSGRPRAEGTSICSYSTTNYAYTSTILLQA
jgi:hypothetical protein